MYKTPELAGRSETNQTLSMPYRDEGLSSQLDELIVFILRL